VFREGPRDPLPNREYARDASGPTAHNVRSFDGTGAGLSPDRCCSQPARQGWRVGRVVVE
jgi:hypothetical protein